MREETISFKYKNNNFVKIKNIYYYFNYMRHTFKKMQSLSLNKYVKIIAL